MNMNKQVITVLALILTFTAAGYAADTSKTRAVKGGLIVHVGATDGKGTVALAGDNFVVQGLSTKPDAVSAARAHVKSADLCGKVSIALFDGEHLPYVDELVNLIVIRQAGKLTRNEIERVLVPGGHAVFAIDNGKNFTKPQPKAIDDWTHYLHDPAGTSVSQDTLAGHPRGLRWTGGPYWARSHEHTNSLNAMVSASGRMFYVMDEGLTDSIQLPAETFLTARDAFNGVVLWKRPLKNWFNALYPLKAGPGWLPRRLVAIGDRVYIAPGAGQNMQCIDAASGKVVRTYDNTPSAFELIVSDGVIFAAIDPNAKVVDYKQEKANCWAESGRANRTWGWKRETGTRVIKAINAESGKLLWKHEAPVAPMTLSSNDTMVCFFDGTALVALNKTTGKQLWKTELAKPRLIATGYSGPRMVICKDRVVLSPMGSIFAVDSKTGDILWSVKGKSKSGHFSQEDFFVLGDKIWVLQRRNSGAYTVYGLGDGKIIEEHINPIKSFYIHQRCYPGKATTNYQLPPVMGMTVYDMKKDTWVNNHWVRGVCIYGVMPANGMVYAGPHACACYYQSKLNGFNALAPVAQKPVAPPSDKRLTKGPAFGKCDSAARSPADWPVFRHDNTRSGYAKTDVPAELAQAWNRKIADKLSQPVVAGGTLLVSAINQHTVYALDAASGKENWHFVAAGRIDSPPTIYKGMAIFGSADGFVYALRLSDGKLAWRFQAAPNDRKLISYGQIESAWPISGSVLVQNDRLYCVAGRSMFLDGGLRMIVLNGATGELITENVMDNKVPATDENLQSRLMGKHMPVSSPDILSSDGKHVYMKSQTFTMNGKRVRIDPQRPDTQYDKEVHLFSPITFLDKSWHQRTYWIYGRAAGEGWAEFQYPPKRVPCGRIMCIDEKNAYSYARDVELLCNTSVSEYRLFSAAKIPTRKVGIPRLEGTWVKGIHDTPKADQLAGNTVDWKRLSKEPKRRLTALNYNWVDDEPDVQAKAMVLANDNLFIAGPRDVADEKALWGRSNEEGFRATMKSQAQWLKGAHGGVMQVFNKKTGKKLKEYKLDSLPSFDGLIAADGKLYMITDKGEVICFKGK
jgi:outer membrane protein assembly factor BamB